jgi:HNH endonuclease
LEADVTTIPHLKRCTKCGDEKPLEQFHKRAASLDGLRPICKTCVKAYQADWMQDPGVAEHRHVYEQQRNQTEKRRLQQNASARRRYARDENKAKRQAETEQHRTERQQARAAQLADPVYQEQQRQKKRAWKKTDRALAQRRKRRAERYTDPAYRDKVNADQRARHPRYLHLQQRGLEKHRARYANDPAYRKAYNAKVNVANHKRRALIDASGSHTEQEWNALCVHYDHRCLCCGEQKPLTKDHVLPLSLGGDNTIHNLQPLCLTCNLRKHAKHIDYRP